jgi:hypothetical protein
LRPNVIDYYLTHRCQQSVVLLEII